MPTGYFRAITVDYDGTLTRDVRPTAEVLAAVAATRARGVRVVLVTGRILTELRVDFPDVDDHFDLVVAENGAVLADGASDRPLVRPLDFALDEALSRRGVPFRRGQVLLACDASHGATVLEEVHRLGFDYQLVYNRASLMILPPGVSKGSGVYEALAQLGLSYHNAVAIGDAENDHSLLSQCELGVAVANAVDALRAHADVVLPEPDGAGVSGFLHGPVLAGTEPVHPGRWQLDLGQAEDGTPVRLPASQLNLLVVGGSRSGKSYVGGLVAEQLVSLGYSVFVSDPQGDHAGLAAFRRVLALGGDDDLPGPGEVAALLRRFRSTVVDLSMVTPEEADAYLARAVGPIQQLREETGLPQWVVIDEAHQQLGRDGALRALLTSGQKGCCVVTYRPEGLCPEALAATDAVILVPGAEHVDGAGLASLAAVVGGVAPREVARLAARAKPGQAVVVQRRRPGEATLFTVATRATPHVRHWHKYAKARLDRQRRFHFRCSSDTATGRAAANLVEFHHELSRCPPEVIGHHVAGGDFSRWIRDVIRDEGLAGAVRDAEGRLLDGHIDAVRQAILAAIEQRYLG